MQDFVSNCSFDVDFKVEHFAVSLLKLSEVYDEETLKL